MATFPGLGAPTPMGRMREDSAQSRQAWFLHNLGEAESFTKRSPNEAQKLTRDYRKDFGETYQQNTRVGVSREGAGEASLPKWLNEYGHLLVHAVYIAAWMYLLKAIGSLWMLTGNAVPEPPQSVLSTVLSTVLSLSKEDADQTWLKTLLGKVLPEVATWVILAWIWSLLRAKGVDKYLTNIKDCIVACVPLLPIQWMVDTLLTRGLDLGAVMYRVSCIEWFKQQQEVLFSTQCRVNAIKKAFKPHLIRLYEEMFVQYCLALHSMQQKFDSKKKARAYLKSIVDQEFDTHFDPNCVFNINTGDMKECELDTPDDQKLRTHLQSLNREVTNKGIWTRRHNQEILLSQIRWTLFHVLIQHMLLAVSLWWLTQVYLQQWDAKCDPPSASCEPHKMNLNEIRQLFFHSEKWWETAMDWLFDGYEVEVRNEVEGYLTHFSLEFDIIVTWATMFTYWSKCNIMDHTDSGQLRHNCVWLKWMLPEFCLCMCMVTIWHLGILTSAPDLDATQDPN